MSLTPTERAALADEFDLNEQYLYQCLTGRAAMKPAEAVRLERLSGGRLTRQMLRPKDWRDIWPELDRIDALHQASSGVHAPSTPHPLPPGSGAN